ncbi:MAG: hypothetical protein M3Z00_04280, partial [Actinomycetota bacterium]|nr:hypothetical protein [Actinomycetota bacterium]
MEYSDGSTDVEPGQDIHAGNDDLGAATYDSDHDGVADSVIVGQGEYTVVVTDSDGDGSADHLTAYDADGHQVDPKEAGLDPSGTHQNSTDSNSTHQNSADANGTHQNGIDSNGIDSNGTAGSPGTGTTASSDTADANSTDPGPDVSSSLTVVDDKGHPVDVGPPTVDMDGDGRNDTAVVRNDDGSTSGY